MISAPRASLKIFSPQHCNRHVVVFGSGKNPDVSEPEQQDDIQSLIRDYKINPKTIDVVSPSGVHFTDKPLIVSKLLEAHLLAQKNKIFGNFSGEYYASNVQLGDGTWGLATNIELGNDNRHFCGERSALQSAFVNALQKLSVGQPYTASDIASLKHELKVKTLLLASDHIFEGNDTPCADCLHWFESSQFFTPETVIVSMRKNPSNGQIYLYARKLIDLLPLWGTRQPSMTNMDISQLPLTLSNRAKVAMTKKKMTSKHLRDLMSKAKKEYQENVSRNLSGKSASTSVLLSDGEMASGSRIDFSPNRRYVMSDLVAVAQAYHGLIPEQTAASSEKNGAESEKKELPAKVNALCYYGLDTSMPSIVNLGYLAKPYLGGPDTLIGVIENNHLQVRTIEDYMPYIYQ